MKRTEVFSLPGQRVFVAGHRGMLGRALTQRLEQGGVEVLKVGREVVDLRRQEEVERWMEKSRPQGVVLAAATVGGIADNLARPADFLYDNLMMEANVIHAAARVGVRRLVLVGSSCIYPREAPQPIREEALLTGPLEESNRPYALAKIAGLELCHTYRRQFGHDFFAVMPTNLYGPGDTYHPHRSHVVPALMLKLFEAKQSLKPSITLWGTGTPQRELLFVEDAADAVVFLLRYYEGEGPVNIGSGEEISIRDLAHKIAALVGYTGVIHWDPLQPDGTPRKRLDTRVLDRLGWRASTYLDEGLARSFSAWREAVIPPGLPTPPGRVS